MKKPNWTNRALATALSGAIMLANMSASSAAPVLSNTAAVKDAAPSGVIDVRRRGNAGAFVGGLVIGGMIGAAVAGHHRGYYGYGPYYPYPYYGYRGYYRPYGYYYPRYYRYPYYPW